MEEEVDLSKIPETVRSAFLQYLDLCHENGILTVPDQTIYQFRGSDVGNILQFAKRYSDVKSIRLNDNFRSNEGIVCVARSVVERNPERLTKKMEGTHAQPYEAGSVLALSFADCDEEAGWMVAKIQGLYGTEYRDSPDRPARGLSYADFAILLRSVRHDAEPIIQALKGENIPFVVGGMAKLFQTQEVHALRNVFYYLADFAPADETALTSAQLRKILLKAGLGLTQDAVNRGIAFLKKRKAQIGNTTMAELFPQRLYLDFLGEIELREENVEQVADDSFRTGEIVYYNLGKFSQVISDFERVNFHTASDGQYQQFANFLRYQAEEYYPEGWEEAAAARPDAVQVITVHQAKGMQWPAVFVPCLRKNRFPSGRRGGRSVWHVIPEAAVKDAARYKGTVEDERRLFHVALTRAERYLFCSWAPIPDNQQQRKVSAPGRRHCPSHLQ
ncbi:ATP-dependent DNA helicase PcrA [Peptococcaceae bacterium CEB3]|nr:ATP-dependent DNA helicase PcrA [Peptococcaceae bacterium CEB3]